MSQHLPKIMKTSLLVVDDSKVARQQILQILRSRGMFRDYLEANSVVEAFKLMLHTPVDVVLCDLEMPGMDGFKFLALVQERPEFRDIPVIILTGHGDRESKIRGLEQGASDYVIKPFDEGELVARVKVQLKIKQLQDKLKSKNALLEELSVTDPLTHLKNRRSLMETLDREMLRSTRTNNPLSLILADLDHFKKVNDTFGHLQGDRVLVAVGQLMGGLVRGYDLAARFGGEEFALVLPDADPGQARLAAQRFLQEVRDLTFDGPLRELQLTLSLGVGTFPHPKIRTVDDLIRETDHALYRAKTNGRNRLELMVS